MRAAVCSRDRIIENLLARRSYAVGKLIVSKKVAAYPVTECVRMGEDPTVIQISSWRKCTFDLDDEKLACVIFRSNI